MADHDRQDHLLVKKNLAQIDTWITMGKCGSDEFNSLMAQTHSELKEHADGEEKNDLPALEATFSGNSSDVAASEFARTKAFAPTR